MARIKNPLMSLDARGSIGKGQVIFQGGTSGTFAFKPKPRDRSGDLKTPQQLNLRNRYSESALAWGNMNASERSGWNEKAKADSRPVSGWNLFVEDRLKSPLYTSNITHDQATANWPPDW